MRNRYPYLVVMAAEPKKEFGDHRGGSHNGVNPPVKETVEGGGVAVSLPNVTQVVG